MFFPGVFTIPTNAGTRITEQRLSSELLRFNPNIWTFKSEQFEFVITKGENGIEVNITPGNQPIPPNLPKCFEEAVWFVLAVPAYAQLIRRRGDGVTRFSIRRARKTLVNTRFRPPLEPEHGHSAEHLGDLMLRYLGYVLPRTDSTYHPTSVNILSVLRNAAITIETLALALAIAIESIVRREFAELGEPDENTLKALDSALDYSSRWEDEGSTKFRIIQAINNWKGSNPRAAMKFLCSKGVITNEQLTAWNSIQHPMAHGQSPNMPVEELLRLCDAQHMAFIRLLFQVLGYSGPYTDRSVANWPRRDFVCARL